MQAVVGQEAPLDHERQPRKLLADLEVTTKTVERTAADATGPDIPAREQEEIQRAVQLESANGSHHGSALLLSQRPV